MLIFTPCKLLFWKSWLNLNWNRYNFCCSKCLTKSCCFLRDLVNSSASPFPLSLILEAGLVWTHTKSISFSVALLPFQHRSSYCRAYLSWAFVMVFLMDSPFSSVQSTPSIQILIKSIYSQCQKQSSFSLAFAFREPQLVNRVLWPFLPWCACHSIPWDGPCLGIMLAVKRSLIAAGHSNDILPSWVLCM